MRTLTGTIAEISSKDWNNVKLWSFKIEGDSRWFRTGRSKPDVEVGSEYMFTERNNQVDVNTIVEVDSVKATEKPSETDANTTATVPQSSQPKTFVEMDVAQRIRWQEARRDATSVIVAALHTEALPWAANVAKGKKLDLLRGYIKTLTEQLLEDENG